MVLTAGDYLIEYSIYLRFDAAADISLTVNGVVNLTTRVSSGTPISMLSGEAILTLNAGDQITLRNTGATQFILRNSPSISAQMNIVKLD